MNEHMTVTRMPPASEVQALIGERIGFETSPASAEPSDLLELILAIEEAYDIEVTEDAAAALVTRGDVLELLGLPRTTH